MLSFIAVLFLFVSGPARSADPPVILVIGDSLSAAYEMMPEQSWPWLLQERLDEKGHRYRVVNASIAGDTTQGGLMRLPPLLERHNPAWVIIELGGNDGLRGVSTDVASSNLDQMLSQSIAMGAQTMLLGVRLPPNYGPVYTDAFLAIYPTLAETHGSLLVPWFLDGVALEPGMMLPDGIHPSPEAQPVLLDNVWEVLGPALQK